MKFSSNDTDANIKAVRQLKEKIDTSLTKITTGTMHERLVSLQSMALKTLQALLLPDATPLHKVTIPVATPAVRLSASR